MRVLAALKKHLLAPDVIGAATDAYRKERKRLSREAARERGSLQRELGQRERKIAKATNRDLGRYRYAISGRMKCSPALYLMRTREFRAVPKSVHPDKQADKAAKAVQRAIRKDNPAKEPPTVGKPVIIDPTDEATPAVKEPQVKKPA
jgi:hypothetical protein